MNMRKIIAVLAAALMLCSVMPLAVSANNVVSNGTFESGTGSWGKSTNTVLSTEAGPDGQALKVAYGDDWGYAYHTISVNQNTDYVITFKAKVNLGGVNINFNNTSWGSAGVTSIKINPTTDWADYRFEFNSGANSKLMLFFQSGCYATQQQIFWLDNLEVIEKALIPTDGNLAVNGDFELGSFAGWEKSQSTVVDAAAAYEGNYGAHLIGGGSWGGMLSATFNTEIGKNYELSFWIKANASGTNIQIKENTWQGADVTSGGWFSGTTWTQKTYTFTATSAKTYLNFCGSGSAAEDLYLDNVVLKEIKDPSFDGYIYNGDFETGKTAPWDIYGTTAVNADAAKSGDYGMMLSGGGASYGGIANQDYTVEIGKTYVVRFDMKVVNAGINVQVKNGGANVKSGYISKTEWATYTYEYTATATNSNLNFCGSGIAGTDVAYLDNVMVYEKVEQSNDGYIVNGTFDTGALTPWENLWGSCTTEVIVGGKESTFALEIVSGQWKHVRQTNIAVEANTNYKISLWSKNVKNMSLLVKDGADTTNIVNKGIANSDDWALTEVTFNSGAYTTILVSFMGGAAEAYGTFDTVVMEKLHTCAHVETSRVEATCGADGSVTYTCSCGDSYTETLPATGEHVYFDDCSAICEVCGYEREVSHNVIHVEAAAPTCTAMGNIEYWYCDACGAAWLDEACTLNTNLRAVKLAATGEHTYDNEFDADCNVCGAERAVVAPVIDVKLSISEDVNGLAFRFEANVAGFAIKAGTFVQADYTNATYNGYKLIETGAIASNGASTITIKGERMCDLDENGKALFAYRIINIPADKLETEITMQPYYIVEIDGEIVTIYGEVQVGAYAEVAVG